MIPHNGMCNVMRERVRPGGLASFGLQVCSDCDAISKQDCWQVGFAACAAD